MFFGKKFALLFVVFSLFVVSAEAKVTSLTRNNFDEFISRNVVVVDFYADWCGPCKLFAPIYQAVADEMAGVALFAKFNLDEGKDVLKQYQVTSFPTLILFKNGNEVARRQGSCDAKTLHAFVQKAL